MNESRVTTLQLCPFSAYREAGLAQRFDVVRWFALDPATQSAWLKQRAESVRAVVTGGHIGCANALIDALPALGIIAINGVGVDKVDQNVARARKVRVTTTPGVLTDDVADLAIGLIIGLLRKIPAADAYVRAGNWPNGEVPLARKVSGRRFGIVGLGQIGTAIAARLAPFGRVAYTDVRRKPCDYEFHADATALARASDILVIASSANASTHHLVGAEVLQALGPQGYLVNVARGSIVDEAALVAALEAGTLGGAALDVFADEPNVPAALRTHPNVVLTPHIASATIETRTAMADAVLANLDAFMAGRAPPGAVI
jgi:lactate dehydrogenase-like 2-hydroxyacid dehydrogenase